MPEEGKPLGVSYRELTAQTIKDGSDKINVFFEKDAKALRIESVYMTLIPVML